ncbi:CoA transferase [Bradyrhizobium sp. LA7.1]|uniref:CoA transferase n=1 Tax=Bradyrhizobium sp. LA7.1 TaxID=3156324 RepID=UPI00339090D9
MLTLEALAQEPNLIHRGSISQGLLAAPRRHFRLRQKFGLSGTPAFDMVVQAMSGLMDVTRAGGMPVKVGISASDVTGGIAGLFAVMCGLEQRRRTGHGAMIDLSMQDVSVWATQTLWNRASAEAHTVATCGDGFVVADCGPELLETVASGVGMLSRSELVERLASAGIPAGSVRTLSEIAQDSCHVGGGAIQLYTDENGKSWPLFKCPYRFSKEKTSEIVAIGALGEANDYIVDLCSATSDAEWRRSDTSQPLSGRDPLGGVEANI